MIIHKPAAVISSYTLYFVHITCQTLFGMWKENKCNYVIFADQSPSLRNQSIRLTKKNQSPNTMTVFQRSSQVLLPYQHNFQKQKRAAKLSEG